MAATTSDQEIINIRIAILAEEPISWGSGKHYFKEILDTYHWKKNNKKFVFNAEFIYDTDVLNGKLTKKNYDVILAPGGGVGDGQAIMKGFTLLRSVRKWKQFIQNFIQDGGGYIGICGGTALLTGLKIDKKKYETFTERQYQKSSLHISCVDSYYKDLALPLFYPFQKKHPEKIGATGYVFSFAPGITKDNQLIYSGGIPIDFQVDTSNPIFSDYTKTNECIRWWGGPALVVPKNPDRNVKIIARYPKIEISENPKTQVYAWSYKGGVLGLIKAFFKAAILIKKSDESLSNLLLYTYYLAGPWKRSNTVINLDFSDKPSITIEEYPNENKGRIVLCTSHPEYMVWWGGKITEMPESPDRCIASGFHKWKEIEPISKDMKKEMMHTWWIVRRFVAWAAKINEDHMPPIEYSDTSKNLEMLKLENVYDGKLINQMKNI